MNSRAILVSGAFCLACILLLGSMAIQLAVGDDRGPEAPTQESPAAAVEEEAEEAVPSPSPTAERRVSAGQRPKELIRLQTLARHAEALMATDPSFQVTPDGRRAVPLSDEAVALFAEMVKTIDESSGLRFVIEVGDPDEIVAAERGELLRSSLLLSLRHPSRLRIEAGTSASPQLTVTATETAVSP